MFLSVILAACKSYTCSGIKKNILTSANHFALLTNSLLNFNLVTGYSLETNFTIEHALYISLLQKNIDATTELHRKNKFAGKIKSINCTRRKEY